MLSFINVKGCTAVDNCYQLLHSLWQGFECRQCANSELHYSLTVSRSPPESVRYFNVQLFNFGVMSTFVSSINYVYFMLLVLMMCWYIVYTNFNLSNSLVTFFVVQEILSRNGFHEPIRQFLTMFLFSICEYCINNILSIERCIKTTNVFRFCSEIHIIYVCMVQ